MTIDHKGRIMAFDYGRKRIGIAVTDPLQMIAGGLDTIAPKDIMAYVANYVAKEDVRLFVVGLPTTVKGEESESMKYIRPFVAKMKKAFEGIPLVMYDERFTSVLAHQAMIAGGVKKGERRDNKELVDKVSATIILQSFLESRQYHEG